MCNAEYIKSAIGIQKVLHERAYQKCDYEEAVDHLYNDMMEKIPSLVAHHIYDLCFLREVFKDTTASKHIKHVIMMDEMLCRLNMATRSR